MTSFGIAVLGSIPSPPWNNISIGPIELRFYGLMIALGVIAGVWLLGRQLETHRLGTVDDASSIAIWSVAAGIIGARLYHVATDWSRFSDDLGSIPEIWEGGLGIPGGLLAGIVVGAWRAKRRRIRPAVILTFAASAIPLAQAIGRWGNWFNQELFGKPTDLPWALEIDDEHLPAGYESGTTFHPTFLYESLWNFALCIVLLRIQRHFRLGPGRLMAVYVMGYGVGRFWIEGLRIDPATEVGGLRWNQWVALAAVLGGAVALVATRGRTWDAASTRFEPGDAAGAVIAGGGEHADGGTNTDTDTDTDTVTDTVTDTGTDTVTDTGTAADDAVDADDADDTADPDASASDAGIGGGGDGGGGDGGGGD